MLAGTYIASSPELPVFGMPLTVGVLLLGANGVAIPSGSVTFSEGGVAIGTATVDVQGRATLVLPSASQAPFSAGTHSVGGVYSGDANYESSTAAPIRIVVAKTPTTLALASPSASGPTGDAESGGHAAGIRKRDAWWRR